MTRPCFEGANKAAKAFLFLGPEADEFKAELRRYGHEVLTASDGREGLELFRQHRPQITLLDLRMPEMGGIEVLKQILAVDPRAAAMVLTGAGQRAWSVRPGSWG